MYVLFLYIILPLRQVFSIHALFLEYLTTRLALTSVLGPFGNSFYPPRCIDALFGVRIPFQSQVQSPEGNPDSSPPIQSPIYVYTGHRTPVGN